MPLRIVRSSSNSSLWSTCTHRFLGEIGERAGPDGYPSFLWMTHRVQRDALYREAVKHGLRGWLAPPVAFLSELPREFDLRLPPVSAFERRMVVSRIAAVHAERLRIPIRTGPDGRGPDSAVDIFIGSLLAESVTVRQLEDALHSVAGDDFAARRNEWIVATYRDYLDHLEAQGRFDPRGIHGFAAARVHGGRLSSALRGATRLHIFGVHSLSSRTALFRALRAQPDVDVVVYLPAEPEPGEWDDLGVPVEDVGTFDGEPVIRVQPAPDERREMEFVAGEVKRLIVEEHARPEEIAVVARVGRDDARRAQEVLEAAGVPTTARTRTPLAEVPALKAILHLFRAAARNWTYRPLRQVLESAYFDVDVDLRSIDYLTTHRLIEGLDEWSKALHRLAARAAEVEERKHLSRAGVFEDRVARDRDAFDAFARNVARIKGEQSMAEWLSLTRELLNPGLFGFRKRLCDAPHGEWDIVRLDQRAVAILDGFLSRWQSDEEKPLTVGEWHGRLRRFLRSNEVILTTPMQTGVQVLEAHEAALFPFRHTFVVHANDGEFPRTPTAGTLFSDEERALLFQAGIPTPPRDVTLRRERTLWRAVAQSQRVTVSYRTADANGVPLLPSLMVDDQAPLTEIRRTQFTWERAFNRPHLELKSARDLSVAAAALPTTLAHPLASPASLRMAIVHAVAETERRGGPAGSGVIAGMPGPWNGLIRDPIVLAKIEERFGPERIWSPSQLEQYAQCPFVFFVQRVLYLDELAEVEDDTTPLVIGGVGHDVLERFYARYAGPIPTEPDGNVLDLLDQVAHEVFHEREANGDWLGKPLLWQVNKREIQERIRRFVSWELPRLLDRRPLKTEYAFGDSEPYVLRGRDVTDQDVEISLRGRIDRVDQSLSGPDCHVLDYKLSSTPTGKWYADGSALQTPLYMRAAADLLGRPVASGGYTAIKRNWTKKRTVAAEIAWDDADYVRALGIALSVPARVRAGYFEARAAGQSGWKSYWTGAAAARTDAVFTDGCRFDE